MTDPNGAMPSIPRNFQLSITINFADRGIRDSNPIQVDVRELRVNRPSLGVWHIARDSLDLYAPVPGEYAVPWLMRQLRAVLDEMREAFDEQVADERVQTMPKTLPARVVPVEPES